MISLIGLVRLVFLPVNTFVLLFQIRFEGVEAFLIIASHGVVVSDFFMFEVDHRETPMHLHRGERIRVGGGGGGGGVQTRRRRSSNEWEMFTAANQFDFVSIVNRSVRTLIDTIQTRKI